jgi:hypothetical protein
MAGADLLAGKLLRGCRRRVPRREAAPRAPSAGCAGGASALLPPRPDAGLRRSPARRLLELRPRARLGTARRCVEQRRGLERRKELRRSSGGVMRGEGDPRARRPLPRPAVLGFGRRRGSPAMAPPPLLIVPRLRLRWQQNQGGGTTPRAQAESRAVAHLAVLLGRRHRARCCRATTSLAARSCCDDSEHEREVVGDGGTRTRGGAARGIEEPLDPSRSRGTGGRWDFPVAFPVTRCRHFSGKKLQQKMARGMASPSAGSLKVKES